MQPSVSLAPPLSRRRAILLAATTAALAAASWVAVRMWRPNPVSVDVVAVEEAVAREQARTCADGDSGRTFIVASTALESARGLPPAAALRAELAVLRTAVQYPTCRPTLLGLAYASEMTKMAEEAIRATWTAPELTAIERAAAAAELATIDAAEPAIERIIAAEPELALVGLAPILRGEASPMWQYSEREAVEQLRDVLRTPARLRAACPAGTTLAACANAVADRPDIGSLVLRRYVERLAKLDALRADLR
jgi:hypothetical protein